MKNERSIPLTTCVFILGLLAIAALRWASANAVGPPGWHSLARLATPAYVALTILCAVRLGRAGLRLDRVGFAVPISPLRALLLGAGGIAALQLTARTIQPLVNGWLGQERDLSRFEGIAESPQMLIGFLVMSWTFAAFGEEIAFRIVLLRAVTESLGAGTSAHAVALVAQALLFGAMHAYQGPAGVFGSLVSGLVFGAVTLLGRGSIWPAAFAHGGNNTIGLLVLAIGQPA